MAKRPRPEDVIPFPCPPQAFTRAYRRALAAGIDLLEELEPGNECATCGHIPCDCQKAKQAPVPIVKAAA